MIRIILVIFSVLVLSSGLIAQDLEAIWNFDGGQAGNSSSGFTNAFTMEKRFWSLKTRLFQDPAK